jgi:poly(3-hydroxybutyrate) depolymerase
MPAIKTQAGKNYFTLISGGVKREYYVHVPPGYNSTAPFPVVFMLHGHSGTGEEFYIKSGWKEVGNAENVLTVFPSSWHYNIIEDGVVEKNARVWNTYSIQFCTGVTPLDDVLFLSRIIDEMKLRYNVDEKKVFLAGFSNGGAMAARCTIELSDRLAAVVTSSGTLPPDSQFTPKRLLPVLYQFGNMDTHVREKLGTTDPLPMDFTKLFSQYPFIQQHINSAISSFRLQPAYTVSGNPQDILIATYKGLSGMADNVFYFGLIEGMRHAYPNSNNLKLAQTNWKWLKKYKLP